MNKSVRYSLEVRARAVRRVLERPPVPGSLWAAMSSSIAGKIGCAAQTLRSCVRWTERDPGLRPGPTGDGQARIKALKCENPRCAPGQ